MFKIKLKNKSNFLLVGTQNGGTTYLGYIPLIDLINDYRRLGPNLFSGNVRGQLFKPNKSGRIPKSYYTDSVFSSMYKTIKDIQKNPDNSLDFFNNNQGILIMADSFDDNGVVTFTKSSHGIGNGQQTVCVGNLLSSNTDPISKDIEVLVKISVGYSDDKFNAMCQCNNNSKGMDKKTFQSNDWRHLEEKVKSMGHILYYKKESNPNKGEFIIDVTNESYLNILSSHVSKKPWITGSNKMNQDVLDVSNLNVDDLLYTHNLFKDINRWVMENNDYFISNGHILDNTRKGGVKNIIATIFKNTENIRKRISMSNDDFYKLCFDDVIEANISNLKGVGYNYFTKERCENHILSCENKLKDILISELV